jgi:hypothetical protein
VTLDRTALVKRAGDSLGCDFCGCYTRPVGVATLHIAGSAFPASICRPCAAVVVKSLGEVLRAVSH